MRSVPSSCISVAVAAIIMGAASVAAAQPSTVIIVRHAEKASTSGSDPSLSEAGVDRGNALAAAVADAHIGSVVTTQYKRTSETAAAVLAARGLEPLTIQATRDISMHVREVVEAVRRRPAGEAVLVVGHSNTVPAIVHALGGPTMAELCESDYDNLFILEFGNGAAPRLIRARYGAPDDPSVDC